MTNCLIIYEVFKLNTRKEKKIHLENVERLENELKITNVTTPLNNSIIQSVVSILEERGFKNIHITRAGATITSHCGEDCLGILYLNDGK